MAEVDLSGLVAGNPRDDMIKRDQEQWLNRLRGTAQNLGFSDFEDKAREELGSVVQQVSYEQNTGRDPGEFLSAAEERLRRRAAPGPGSDTNIPGGTTTTTTTTGGGGGNPLGYAPNQFTDPYTRQLEEIAKAQMASLQGRNAQMEKLMSFLDQEFERISNAPGGWTPDELAMLRTQAIEPITAQRDAAMQRIALRAGQRGLLPTSGVVQSEQGDTERAALALQAQANRDIALQGVARQRQNLQDALNLGQLAVALPDQRNAQALNIAQMLYQLPRNAMTDAMTVINASSPTAGLAPLLNLMQMQQNQGNTNAQNSAALWALLGQIFGQVV